ncbi:hypothetical protein KUTeg_015304 [Tegillarca granosa]|uniref:Uncharacterized protein n=1 Tax=Tegillarca granosa TaxID=220873 RepID=A0ABQ9EPX5_TEGGR|nr:hypothetical protein KUTeg_015304 [Tegillarca granosa]
MRKEKFKRIERMLKKEEINRQSRTGTRIDLQRSFRAAKENKEVGKYVWLRKSAGTNLNNSSNNSNSVENESANRQNLVRLGQSLRRTVNFQDKQGMELENRMQPADQQQVAQRNFGTSEPFQKNLLQELRESKLIEKVPRLRKRTAIHSSMSS